MAWGQGRAVVESLIRTGMLEQVPPNPDAAKSRVDVAGDSSCISGMLAGSRAGSGVRGVAGVARLLAARRRVWLCVVVASR